MRRRQPVPERRLRLEDMPAHLAVFDPIDWGCFTAARWSPEFQQAHRSWHQARQQWETEHGVDVVEELLRQRAERRARELSS